MDGCFVLSYLTCIESKVESTLGDLKKEIDAAEKSNILALCNSFLNPNLNSEVSGFLEHDGRITSVKTHAQVNCLELTGPSTHSSACGASCSSLNLHVSKGTFYSGRNPNP